MFLAVFPHLLKKKKPWPSVPESPYGPTALLFCPITLFCAAVGSCTRVSRPESTFPPRQQPTLALLTATDPLCVCAVCISFLAVEEVGVGAAVGVLDPVKVHVSTLSARRCVQSHPHLPFSSHLRRPFTAQTRQPACFTAHHGADPPLPGDWRSHAPPSPPSPSPSPADTTPLPEAARLARALRGASQTAG